MTRREARSAVRWFLQTMGLKDWEVKLSWSDKPPDWARPPADDPGVYGVEIGTPRWKTAQVWVSPLRADEGGVPPEEALFHELGHVWFDDLEIATGETHEYALNRFGEAMGKLWKVTRKDGQENEES